MPTGLNKLGDALIGPLNPRGLIEQFQGDARLMPQNIVALAKEVLRLRGAIADIQQATLDGKVCDDVAWFDGITTLHDFCAGTLEQNNYVQPELPLPATT
jgi:hypothetical protein